MSESKPQSMEALVAMAAETVAKRPPQPSLAEVLSGVAADWRRFLGEAFPKRELTPEELADRVRWATVAEHEERLAARRDRYGRERRALALGCSLAMLEFVEAQQTRVDELAAEVDRLRKLTR